MYCKSVATLVPPQCGRLRIAWVKQIGVRKVLGASVINITALLSKGFIQLIAIVLLIATPVAWWALGRWLAGFAYRIHQSWWMFSLAGVFIAGATLLVVGLQAMKAAMAKPVVSLREN